MKIGIVVGHNSKAKGAYGGEPISAYEFDFNSSVAEIMDELAAEYGMDAKIFTRKDRGSYRNEIEDVYKKTDKWGAGVTIELHFNAYDKKTAGTETLSGPSTASMRTAMSVQKLIATLYDRSAKTDRGVKPYRTIDRGRLSLISGKAPAILVEPFFGDNPSDTELAFAVGKEKLASAYLKGIADAWDTNPVNRSFGLGDLGESTLTDPTFAHWR